jgi:homocysteine S-methyltransferase
MGTELLARGAAPGSCLPELNLSRPELVGAVHRDYAAAGAELHRTNTFTANRLRLAAHGLGDRVRDLNSAGARIAREAAGRSGRVVGSVGPLSDLEAPAAEKRRAYAEQCSILVEAGCGMIFLETFTESADLLAALEAASGFGVPVAALGVRDSVSRPAGELGAAWAGVNCTSPAEAARSLRAMRDLDGRALLAAFPGAGPPGAVLAPERFAAEVAELGKSGARILGGCCGAGPEHVGALAAILRRPRPSG